VIKARRVSTLACRGVHSGVWRLLSDAHGVCRPIPQRIEEVL
jgi:hypothetical protein